MRKYRQFIAVLLVFFLLVWIRQAGQSGAETLNSPLAQQNQVNLPTPTASTGSGAASPLTKGSFKDGSYTGTIADAYYGPIQVQAVVSSGRLTAVNILQYPNDNHTSISINQAALPILQEEAIQAQSANVDFVSGASATSPAFQESLQAALSQAV